MTLAILVDICRSIYISIHRWAGCGIDSGQVHQKTKNHLALPHLPQERLSSPGPTPEAFGLGPPTPQGPSSLGPAGLHPNDGQPRYHSAPSSGSGPGHMPWTGAEGIREEMPRKREAQEGPRSCCPGQQGHVLRWPGGQCRSAPGNKTLLGAGLRPTEGTNVQRKWQRGAGWLHCLGGSGVEVGLWPGLACCPALGLSLTPPRVPPQPMSVAQVLQYALHEAVI